MRSVSSCSCQLLAHPKIVCSEDAFTFKGHNTGSTCQLKEVITRCVERFLLTRPGRSPDAWELRPRLSAEATTCGRLTVIENILMRSELWPAYIAHPRAQKNSARSLRLGIRHSVARRADAPSTNARDPFQLPGRSHRYRPACRALAAPVEAESAWSGGDGLGARLWVHPWDGSRLGSPCCPAHRRPPASQAKRSGWPAWDVDETSVNVKGTWCSLSRAIDREGNLVDSMRSREARDGGSQALWSAQAVDVVGHAPQRVTTDGHDSSPRAMREPLGSDVLHRTNRCLTTRLEQDHRGIKQRNSAMRGLGSVASASRFCRAFDEVRQCFRFRTTGKQKRRTLLSHRCSLLRFEYD